MVELIQSGAIGPVTEVHVWVSRAWGWQSEAEANEQGYRLGDRAAAGKFPVPDRLDWDLWLGPAPYRPFHEVYFPGPNGIAGGILATAR